MSRESPECKEEYEYCNQGGPEMMGPTDEEMEEMRFEKDFPSLKDEITKAGTDLLGDAVHCESIQKHCLDKQKIIEILKKSKDLQDAIRRLESGSP